jgi:hypothetical protein
MPNFIKSKAGFLDASYGITEENKKLCNPNTGIIFWNNEFCDKINLSLNALKLHKENYAIENDQSLLALYIYIHKIKYNILGPEYNFRTGNKTDLDLNIPIEDLIVIHYTSPKPWSPDQYKFTDHKYVSLWWKFIHINKKYFHSNQLAKKWLKKSIKVEMILQFQRLSCVMHMLKLGKILKMFRLS